MGAGSYKLPKLNKKEKALALEHPREFSVYVACGREAVRMTSERYKNGRDLGNGDAFRHAVWNALLVCRFFAMGKGTPDQCQELARKWTSAHEVPFEERKYEEMSLDQFMTDKEMDLINNRLGRILGRIYIDDEDRAIEAIGRKIDSGEFVKIKEDRQMSWRVRRLIEEIPEWTLKKTSIKGKATI